MTNEKQELKNEFIKRFGNDELLETIFICEYEKIKDGEKIIVMKNRHHVIPSIYSGLMCKFCKVRICTVCHKELESDDDLKHGYHF